MGIAIANETFTISQIFLGGFYQNYPQFITVFKNKIIPFLIK